MGTADGATATSASAASTGMDVGTDPFRPRLPLPLPSIYLPSFDTYADVLLTWLSIRPLVLLLLLTSPITRPGDVSGTMLRSVGLATTMLPVAASPWPPMSPLTSLLTADHDSAIIPSKKRRRPGGPARAAREAAFLASKVYDATDSP